MSKEEIVNCAIFAYESGYGSLMLQSGELPTDKRLAFLIDTIKEVKRVTIEKDKERNGVKEGVENKGLGVAISLGELTKVSPPLSRTIYCLLPTDGLRRTCTEH